MSKQLYSKNYKAESIPDSFAHKILKVRLDKGFSQKVLCHKMDIPINTYRSWEQGLTTPPKYLRRIIINAIKQVYVPPSQHKE